LDSYPNGGWWNFGPSKRALEKLFMQGDLMVSERIGMEKVYDLRERLLPAGLNVQEPDINDFVAYLLQSHLRAHGVVTLEQLIHLHTDKAVKSAMRQLLAEQVHGGILRQLSDMPNTYIETAALDQTESNENTAVHLLSPFDNAVIHRKRLEQLFAFEYRLECYTPPAKREFGYFCLPILFGNRFVGRIDCKAHRRQKILEVLSLHLETELADKNTFAQQLMLKLQLFAEFNGCNTIEIRQVDQAFRQLLDISGLPA
ncbi:MAG: winged helix DNA-binding domain-containing protein, partial [Burkholderiales bacterium]|nr:winged helix DNA-binding domain-containing protein [Burkholderiales bacterium]